VERNSWFSKFCKYILRRFRKPNKDTVSNNDDLFSKRKYIPNSDYKYDFIISPLCKIQYISLNNTNLNSSSGTDYFGSNILMTLSGKSIFISQPSFSYVNDSTVGNNGMLFVTSDCMKCWDNNNNFSCSYYTIYPTEGCPPISSFSKNTSNDVGCHFSSSISFDHLNLILTVGAEGLF
jgi:hypothetical protein